jgi:hypothetical protein
MSLAAAPRHSRIGTALLVAVTAILGAIGLVVVIGVHTRSYDHLPAANRDLVLKLQTSLPPERTYAWSDFLPQADMVCVISFDTDPREALPRLLNRPVTVPPGEAGRLREQHWTLALVTGGSAELYDLPISHVRPEPDADSCDPWASAQFSIRDDGDKRYIRRGPWPPGGVSTP